MDKKGGSLEKSERLEKLHKELEEIQMKAAEELNKRKAVDEDNLSSPLAATIKKVSFEQPAVTNRKVAERKTEAFTAEKATLKATTSSKPTYVEESRLTQMSQGLTVSSTKIRANSRLILWVGASFFLVVVLVVMGLYLIGKSVSDKKTLPTNWEECFQAKDSVVQESLPRICVTRGGKRFVEPIRVEVPTQVPVQAPSQISPTLAPSSPSGKTQP